MVSNDHERQAAVEAEAEAEKAQRERIYQMHGLARANISLHDDDDGGGGCFLTTAAIDRGWAYDTDDVALCEVVVGEEEA